MSKTQKQGVNQVASHASTTSEPHGFGISALVRYRIRESKRRHVHFMANSISAVNLSIPEGGTESNWPRPVLQGCLLSFSRVL